MCDYLPHSKNISSWYAKSAVRLMCSLYSLQSELSCGDAVESENARAYPKGDYLISWRLEDS
jgi:hypothetical protein